MPSSLTTTLLVLGAVLTSVSALAGCIVAGLGFLWEAFLFARLGVTDGG
jgi:hypothetical protein